ncbi:hypothetical protein [Macromonas nakdongensis]|uniref:hypothetical protein n=1 Tax=Macromonas nakdongensis TaxID=1843082 RepID=UPI0012FF15FC|nr:hypothetical protein [Macromonas nakdongensis]
MAHLYRLIFLFLFSFASPAFAAVTYSYSHPSCASSTKGCTTISASTLPAIEAAIIAWWNGNSFNGGGWVHCNTRNPSWSGLTLYLTNDTRSGSCSGSYGTTYSNIAHTIVQSGTPDPTPSCPSSGTSNGETSTTIALGSFPNSALGVDSNGCVISVQCTTIVEYDGRRDCIGTSTFTGQTGTGSPSGVFTEEQIEKAKEGYCQGEVNGTTVYVPCSGVSQNTDTSTTTNADGSTSTTKTSTSCQDGKCTTTETTTTTDAQGNTTASGTTKTESQSDFCQSNPGHASCKAGSFGGSCEAGFKCDGDAIQCAMAKVQHENKCALTPAPNAGAAYFDALTEGMPTNPNSGTVTVGSSMFNTSNLLGASSCTLDKSITVWGSTINLPFSQVCTALAYMGTLLQAVGFLLGARIITRG